MKKHNLAICFLILATLISLSAMLFEKLTNDKTSVSNIKNVTCETNSKLKSSDILGETSISPSALKTTSDTISYNTSSPEPTTEPIITKDSTTLNTMPEITSEPIIKTTMKPETRYVTAYNNLNVRRKPNTESKIIDSLNYAKKITIYEISNQWGRISKDNKKEKWICLDYTKKKLSSKKKGKIYKEVPLSASIQQYAAKMCKKRKIPLDMFMGLINAESTFNPKVIGGGHDYGLCQIRDTNHKYLEKKLGNLNFLDSYDSINAATYFLANYRDTYGEGRGWTYVLMCYNLGPGTADYYWNHNITSTSYPEKIFKYAEKIN